MPTHIIQPTRRIYINPSPSPSAQPYSSAPFPKIRKKPVSYTLILIIINVVFFLAVMLSPYLIGDKNFEAFFMNNIAFTPATFLLHPWTIITSMFMHATPTHLFVNMISLFFLGTFVEKVIGSKRFLKLYLAGGIAGSLLLFLLYSVSANPQIISLSLFTNPAIKTAADISAVGASAAIFALAGCLAILVPRMSVIVFFVIPMRIWVAVIFLIIALSVIPGVANSAHVGGLLVGIFYALYLKKKYRKKVRMLNRMMGF